MVKAINVAGRMVGPGHPCFIIAEAGVNHNGEIEKALQLVEVAAKAGADAVKFQTFRAENLAIPEAPKAEYQTLVTGETESQLDMLRRLELPPHAYRELEKYCRQQNILFMSAPFEEESADLLEDLGLPVFKIPSGEVTNLPFLAHVARKSKPLILSTGMATLEEVRAAVDTIKETGDREIILLHCVSNYPVDPADANLRAMHILGSAFGVPVGYSDHTLGIEVPLAAVALGACVIEKHMTLDLSLPGPDHQASLDPQEVAEMVRGIRVVEAALGHGRKQPAACEASIAAVVRKSLVASRAIPVGSVLTEDMVSIKRPGTGLPPGMRSRVLGRRVTRDVKEGTLLSMDMFA